MALKVVDNYFHTKKDAVGFAKVYKTKAKKGGLVVQTHIAKVLDYPQTAYLVLLRTQKILPSYNIKRFAVRPALPFQRR